MMDVRFREDHAEYGPWVRVSLEEAVRLITIAIEHCYVMGETKLLCNILGMTGFEVPTLADRYWFANEWARAGQGKVILAIVAPEQLIDPQKIGVKLARSAGMLANVFRTDEEAVEWLKDQ